MPDDKKEHGEIQKPDDVQPPLRRMQEVANALSKESVAERRTAGGRSGMFSFPLGDLKIHTKLPEDHPFYALVGRVASEWSHLEHLLDETIWDLLWTDRALAACVTSQLVGVGSRCKAIETLCKARNLSKEVRAPFKQLKNDSFSVSDWRNRWVHDVWFLEVISGKAAQFRAMPVVDPRYGQQEIAVDDINETIRRIHGLQTLAIQAGNAVRVELASPLLEKST